jgi:hypothetical protein
MVQIKQACVEDMLYGLVGRGAIFTFSPDVHVPDLCAPEIIDFEPLVNCVFQTLNERLIKNESEALHAYLVMEARSKTENGCMPYLRLIVKAPGDTSPDDFRRNVVRLASEMCESNFMFESDKPAIKSWLREKCFGALTGVTSIDEARVKCLAEGFSAEPKTRTHFYISNGRAFSFTRGDAGFDASGVRDVEGNVFQATVTAGEKTEVRLAKKKREYVYQTDETYAKAMKCYGARVSKQELSLALGFLKKTWKDLLAKERSQRQHLSKAHRDSLKAGQQGLVCGYSKDQIVPHHAVASMGDLEEYVEFVAAEIMRDDVNRLYQKWFDEAMSMFDEPVRAPVLPMDDEPENEQEREQGKEALQRIRDSMNRGKPNPARTRSYEGVDFSESSDQQVTDDQKVTDDQQVTDDQKVTDDDPDLKYFINLNSERQEEVLATPSGLLVDAHGRGFGAECAASGM